MNQFTNNSKEEITMAKIKSYTDLEQSKKLAEILPLKSADMFYRDNGIDAKLMWEHNAQKITNPCWSLSALLGVLPQTVRLVGTPKDSYWYCECVNGNNQWYAGFESADNPIDACYKMIIRLNEQKKL